MVFAALDYYYAGRPVPPEAAPPQVGSPTFRYVARRLFASFALPRGVLRYQRYMARPDGNYRLFGATRPGVSWLTIARHWPDIRRSLDAGRPTPLGLVTARGLNPLDLGRNHVVLAYDYALTDDNLIIRVYDPNTGPADDVRLVLSPAAPGRATSITHNIDIGQLDPRLLPGIVSALQPTADGLIRGCSCRRYCRFWDHPIGSRP